MMEIIDETITPDMKLNPNLKAQIDWDLYNKLKLLGIINTKESNVRDHNVGTSNYSKHTIQPWSIWLDYPELTSWDHDIIKRVLRTKKGETRSMDYEKIIHDCEERLRQIEIENEIQNIH